MKLQDPNTHWTCKRSNPKVKQCAEKRKVVVRNKEEYWFIMWCTSFYIAVNLGQFLHE